MSEELSDQPEQNDAALYEQFVRLFAKHDRRLFAYIMALVQDPIDAEDVFSETSIILWREFPKFRQEADFAPWALAIAFNQIRKHRRKVKRDRLLFSESLITVLAKDAAQMAEQVDERTEALRWCVSQLQQRSREMLNWFYGAGMAAGEIADRWGLTVHAVYKSLKTTRKALLRCIEQRLAQQSGRA